MHLDTVKLQDYLKFVRRTDSPFTRKRKAYHHGDLRRVLVEAALSLLTKTQRWDFSLREVARRANVSHNAPYSHFASKRDLLAAVAAKGYEILRARVLTALRGKTKPADALKAISIAYLRFATENPAHYRLMFGPTLQGQDGRLPSEVIRAFASAEAVYREVLKQGSEDGAFKIPQNDRGALETALIANWSVLHGLAMLYIDGLATLETAQTIDSLAEKVVGIFMYGLVKREKQDCDA
jgi:AcrR family transcriptional regulator